MPPRTPRHIPHGSSPFGGVEGAIPPLQGGGGAVVPVDLGGCPAAVDRRTGTLYVDPEAMARLTPFQRRFVILHEEGHWRLGTDDEIRADAYAFDRLAGTQPRSLRQSVESLEQILDDDNPTLRPRYRALLRRALEWDADHGNPRAAAELGRVSYMSKGKIAAEAQADAMRQNAETQALQAEYAGESLLRQTQNTGLLYIGVCVVLALWLL